MFSLAVDSLVALGLAQDPPPTQIAPVAPLPPEQEPVILQEHHPWGRFAPGAWKLVRVVTEAFDEKDNIVNTDTVETKTTLVKLEDDGVTLEVEVCVEVAGKRFARAPQIVKQGFHGEPVSEQLKMKYAGTGTVTVDGRAIPCRIIRLESNTGTAKTVTNLYYSALTPPYILKREIVTTDVAGETQLSETSVRVVALDVQCDACESIGGMSHLEAVSKHSKGSVKASVFSSTEVPGGIVSQESEEFDKDNHLLRRSTLQMLSYGLKVEPERTGLFGGLFSGRRRVVPYRKPPKRQQTW